MADDGQLHALLTGPLKLGRGRRPTPLRVVFKRELTAEDLVSMSQAASLPQPEIKMLRQTHHRLAQCLAQGLPEAEVAMITGYSVGRISVLKADPMFQALQAYYEAMEEEHYAVARADMHERLKNLGFDSLELLHERILEEPASFDNKTLLAVVEASADRTGHGKSSTLKVDHDHSLSDATIAKIKAATALGRPLQEEDRGALLRLAAARTAEVHTAGEAGDWIEGEGTLLREACGSGAEAEVPGGALPLPSVD